MKMKNLVFACALGLAGNISMGMDNNRNKAKNFEMARQVRLSAMHHNNYVKKLNIQTTKKVNRKLLNIAYAYHDPHMEWAGCIKETPDESDEKLIKKDNPNYDDTKIWYAARKMTVDANIKLLKQINPNCSDEEISSAAHAMILTADGSGIYNTSCVNAINKIADFLEKSDKSNRILINNILSKIKFELTPSTPLSIAKLLLTCPEYYQYIVKTLFNTSIYTCEIKLAQSWYRILKLKNDFSNI